MKYAVVTGSTKGIGRAIAEKLLSEGWYVICNYANDDAGASLFEQRNDMYKGAFSIIKCVIRTWEDVQIFIRKTFAITSRIDALVLNVGATDRTPFDEIDHKVWEDVVATNVSAPFFLAHGFRNAFVEGGRILFIGSVCGIFPHAGSPAYGVTKAAVHQMAKELVKFFAPKRVTVNAIAPGFTDTPRQSVKDPLQRSRIEKKTADGRFGRPEEISNLCWEVLNNDFINGAVLSIDGGYCYR